DPAVDRSAFEAAWKNEASAARDLRTYDPHYEGSPVVTGPAGAKCGINGPQARRATPGRHLAPCSLSSGCNVHEDMGRDYALLAIGASASDGEALTSAALHLGVPLKVVTDTAEGDRRDYEHRLVLVRPDHYVAWVGEKAPADPTAIFRTITGRG